MTQAAMAQAYHAQQLLAAADAATAADAAPDAAPAPEGVAAMDVDGEVAPATVDVAAVGGAEGESELPSLAPPPLAGEAAASAEAAPATEAPADAPEQATAAAE